MLKRRWARPERAFDRLDALRVVPGRPAPQVLNEGGRLEAGSIELHPGVRLWAHKGGVLTIGDRTVLHRGAEVIAWERVTIGRDCMVGWDVIIMDTDLHQVGDRPLRNKPVTIGDGVRIGCRSIILKGVTIGDGAVVAAGSIVTRDVAPGTLVACEPARVVGSVPVPAGGGN
jgi:acetyltransferase-like isoleucine patch superfamily enzyme